MSDSRHQLDRLREGQGEIANHVIDEFAAGRISRRTFLRNGTVVGISLPALGAALAACGSSASPSPGGVAGKAGATIRAGIVVPAGEINPLTVADVGGLDMLGQTGEYLCLSDQQLRLRPVLAESWTPNSAGDVWRFKIRQGVTFHDGRPLTADDVVYTYRLQTSPKNGGSALSAFGGVLTPSGVRKAGDFTVDFHLESPNGNFPYLTSSDNYNMIILPKGYDPAKWQGSFIGTGPFVLNRYTPKQGASFTRNKHYWGRKALPAATEFTFYDTQTPQILALTSGSLDVLSTFSLMSTPISLAACTTIWAYSGISRACWVTSWVLNPDGCPAAASSAFALAMFFARCGMPGLVDGKTGAKVLSLPTSAKPLNRA